MYFVVHFLHFIFTEKLKFRPKPVNTKLELGSTSKVHCIAEGQDPPVIYWKGEDGHDLSQEGHIHDAGGVLTFNGVTRNDAGSYTCIASSSQGIINATIYIDVVGMFTNIIQKLLCSEEICELSYKHYKCL